MLRSGSGIFVRSLYRGTVAGGSRAISSALAAAPGLCAAPQARSVRSLRVRVSAVGSTGLSSFVSRSCRRICGISRQLVDPMRVLSRPMHGGSLLRCEAKKGGKEDKKEDKKEEKKEKKKEDKKGGDKEEKKEKKDGKKGDKDKEGKKEGKKPSKRPPPAMVITPAQAPVPVRIHVEPAASPLSGRDAPSAAGSRAGHRSEADDDEERILEVFTNVAIMDPLEETAELDLIAEEIEEKSPRVVRLAIAPPQKGTPTLKATARANSAEVSVAFCDDDYIRNLNRDYRGMDKPTDVLSFPLMEPDEKGKFFMPGGRAVLGDVIISVDTARRQADERGHSLQREVQILLVHGILHLLGHDHESGGAEAVTMAAEEERILRTMGWSEKGLIMAQGGLDHPSGAADMDMSGADDDDKGGEQPGGAKASALRATPLRSLLRVPPKPAVELLCLDMDGTLLDSKSRVSPAVAASIREVLSAGIRVVVATGKARAGAEAALRAAGLAGAGGIVSPGHPGVFLQGLLVYGKEGRLAHSEQLTPDVLRYAFDVSLDSGIALCAFAGDRALSLRESKLLDKLHSVYHEPKVLASFDSLLAQPPAQKLLFYGKTPEEVAVLRRLLEGSLEGKATVTQAVPHMLEILPLGSSKGNGVAKLLKGLEVKADAVAAIGDGENDVGMLQLVGTSIAMGNAVPQAKRVAKHVLGASNDEDGVAEAIDRYILRKIAPEEDY